MVNVDIIFKIAGIGILTAVLYMVLKEAGRQTQAEIAAIAGVVVVLVYIIPLLAGLFEQVKSVFRLF